MGLFSPCQFKSGTQIENRIILAPLTNTQSNPDCTLGEDEFIWLQKRAQGGFGMLVSCATHVSPHGQGWPGELGIHDERFIEGWVRLNQMCSANQTPLVAQIFHGGARSPSRLTGERPRSASEFDLNLEGFERPRSMTENEILAVIEDFGKAAGRAVRTGCAGVEIHGANGYLITQFLSTHSNTRNDRWGGSFENRSRFLQEVYKRVRKEAGSQKIVGVRLSPDATPTLGGLDLDESLNLSEWLIAEGADYIHLSLWNAWKNSDKYGESRPAIVRQFADQIGGRVPLMVAGKIWTRNEAEQILDLGADLIAIGAAAIANPDWPHQVRTNPAFEPARFPLKPSEFAARGVSPRFVDYLRARKWVAPE